MTLHQKRILRYSISFKQKVVREIEKEGLSIGSAARRYGITGGSTIQRWIKKFGKNHLLSQVIRIEMKGEKDRLKELESENKRLKIALADATMQNHVLEKLIEVANENYETDLKKNLGLQSSKKATRKKGTR